MEKKTPKKLNTVSQCSLWDLRWNADAITQSWLISKFKEVAKKWVFQLEEGETTKYKHFQCRVSLMKKAIKSSVLKLFTDFPPNYCMPSTNETFNNQKFSYVMKEQTRLEGPWSDQDPEPPYVPRQYQHIKKLYPFQEDILSGKYYDNRRINYIFDTEGNSAKSTTAFFAYQKGGLVVPPINNANKLCEFICSKYKKLDSPKHYKLAIYDLPRAMKKDSLSELFTTIEMHKTGYIYDTRYTGFDMMVDSPDIWVFSNDLPELSYLSMDRWRFFKIGSKHQLKEFSLTKNKEVRDHFKDYDYGIPPT